MHTSFSLQLELNISPEDLYAAWLSSEIHSAMTGGEAVCSDRIDQEFSAWDGYIQGRNIELVEPNKIVQTWRTSDFGPNDDDSRIELVISSTPTGCSLTLAHFDIPEGQPDYAQGWKEHYFTPMKEYFSS